MSYPVTVATYIVYVPARASHSRDVRRIGVGDAATGTAPVRLLSIEYCSTTETFPMYTLTTRHARHRQPCAYNTFPKNSGNTGISTPNGNRDINTRIAKSTHKKPVLGFSCAEQADTNPACPPWIPLLLGYGRAADYAAAESTQTLCPHSHSTPNSTPESAPSYSPRLPSPPLPPLMPSAITRFPPVTLPCAACSLPHSSSALDRLDHLNHDRDQQVERFDDDLAAQVGAERARE